MYRLIYHLHKTWLIANAAHNEHSAPSHPSFLKRGAEQANTLSAFANQHVQVRSQSCKLYDRYSTTMPSLGKEWRITYVYGQLVLH
jgi:hypothetical protein